MGTIGYGYGSEWHLLRYLGYHRDDLSRRVMAVTGAESVRWLDSPFSSSNRPLHADREHRGLDFIDDPAVQAAWRAFWPQSGSAQSWDAVAEIQVDGRSEWLLVEAKAHIGELRSQCRATSPASRTLIEDALRQASDAFGNTTQPLTCWTDRTYQTANRLAVLTFLMTRCEPPVPARLLFIYVCGDAVPGADCPRSEAEWAPALRDVKTQLGISPSAALAGRVHEVFLPVNPEVASDS